jgi:FkbM family methyltransferase
MYDTLAELRRRFPQASLEPARFEGRFVRDSLGGRTRISYLRRSSPTVDLAERNTFLNLFQPGPTSDYLDWQTVLEAAAAAGSAFHMIELGAGWGRWSVLAGLAARAFGKKLGPLAAYEAEPTHYAWTRRHFADNGLPPRRHRVVRAAVGGADGVGAFYVGRPQAWYGQALQPAGQATPWLARCWRRWRGGDALTTVPVVGLSTILADYDRVDLVHMDIQGAERDVAAGAIDALDAKVRLVHIATHSPDTAATGGHDVEDPLRRLFSERGWQRRIDVPCRGQVEICGHDVRVNDGVQVWLNPRLAA